LSSPTRGPSPDGRVGALDEGEWTPTDERQAGLHRALILLRNRRYAHTDQADLRGVEDVLGEGSYSETSVGLADEAWPRIVELAEAQGRRMSELAKLLGGAIGALPE
jgi:hypothetical protein